MTMEDNRAGYESTDVGGPRDLTHIDFSEAPVYASVDPAAHPAQQLTQPTTLLHTWGQQDMKPGDWIVTRRAKDGSTKHIGVRSTAFERTYQHIGEGLYRRVGKIKALRIPYDYKFVGIDSDSFEHAPAGSYIVLNLGTDDTPLLHNGRRDVYYYSQHDLQARFALEQSNTG